MITIEGAPERPREPTWTVLDAFVGLVVAIVFSSAVAVLVLTTRDYDTVPWSEIGAAAGRAAGLTGDGVLSVPKLVPLWLLTLLNVPLWLGLLGAAVVATRYKGDGLVRDLGLSMQPLDIGLGLAIGAFTQLVVVPALYTLLFLVIGDHDLSANARSITDRAHGAGVVLLVVLTIVAAPLVEEIFFRGLLYRALRRSFGVPTAVVASALVFSLVHFQLLELPALMVFGVILALLTQRFGRLGPNLWAHVGFNATTVVLLLAAR